MLSYEAAVFLLMAASVYAVVFLLGRTKKDLLEKWGVSIESLAIMVRTARFNKFIENMGFRFRRFWRFYGSLSLLAGVLMSVYGIHTLHLNALLLLKGAKGAMPTHPVIPGVTIGFDALPYLSLALVITLIPHELSHGFAFSAERIPIESAGVFFFLVLPGGFVEPNEEMLGKMEFMAKLRAFAVGSFTNLITGILIGILMSMILVPSNVGAVVNKIAPGTPASQGLSEGDIIKAMNNTRIGNSTDLVRFLSKTKPGDKVILLVERNGEETEIEITLAAHPYNKSRGYIGAVFGDYYPADPHGYLFKALWWSYVVALSIAVINIVPIYPFDGGRILREILVKIFGEDLGHKITIVISVYLLLVLLVNIALSIAKWGLQIWYP